MPIIQALKSSELRYRRLFEAAQDGILILDAETGMIEDVNPYLIKMLGYSREEFVKKKLWEVGAFKDVESSKEAFEALQQNEYIRYEDLPLKTKDGRLVQVEFVSNVYLVDDAKVIQCNIRDISERVRAEEALHLQSAALNAAAHAVMLTDRNGAIESINPAFTKLTGYTLEESVGKNPRELLKSGKQEPVFYQKFWETILAGNVWHNELINRRKDGSLYVEEETITPLKNAAGRISHFIAVKWDITESKRAAENLRESEERYRLLMETLPDGVIVHSQGRIVFANPTSAAILGAAGPVALIGKSTIRFVHPDYRKLVLKRIRQALNKGAPIPLMEEKFVRQDGTTLDVELSAVPFSYAGKPAMLTVFNDITQRKQAEIEIRQNLSELEVLYQSGLAFSQLITPRAIAQKVIDLLDQKMDWHHTAIRFHHPESGTLELLAFNLPNLNTQEEYDAAEKPFKRIQRPGQGLSGWVFQHGQAVRSNDLKNDPRYFETFPGLQSGLYVPIKIAERVVGVISIESKQAQAFSESDERLTITLAAQAAIAMDNAQLFESLKLSNIELASAYDATIEGWSRALDLRDKETEGHSRRVTEMTLSLARGMGLSEAELVHVRRGALLHDIGKMGVPDGILLKPGPLTDEEWVKMRKHPLFAYEMLSPIRYLRPALDIPYCHHEKWDGGGYPRGLKGAEIPLVARIFAVVDVWDALSSDRPYRAKWTEEKVREHIQFSSGKHFDPQVVDVFMQML